MPTDVMIMSLMLTAVTGWVAVRRLAAAVLSDRSIFVFTGNFPWVLKGSIFALHLSMGSFFSSVYLTGKSSLCAIVTGGSSNPAKRLSDVSVFTVFFSDGRCEEATMREEGVVK